MNIDILIKKIKNLKIEDFTPIKAFINNIYSYINENNLIDTGTLGSIYNIPNSDLVMKVVSPCTDLNIMGIEKIYCDNMHSKEQIRHIPYVKSTNIEILLLMIANYLSEGIIGGLLNALADYTPHFIKINAIYFSKFNNQSYMIMEHISTDLNNIIKTKEDLYLLLFQIAYSLSIAQKYYKFTHYDLHIKNIGYIITPNNYQYHLINFNQTIYVKNQKFIAKIFDFEFSRLENEQDSFIVNPMFEGIIDTHSVFNPYYDFMSLIGSLKYHDFIIGEDYVPINLLELLSEEEQNDLFRLVFNLNVSESLEKYYDINSLWRPIQSDIRSADHSFANIDQITYWLANKLAELNVITDNSKNNNVITTIPFLNNYTFKIPERKFVHDLNFNKDPSYEYKIDEGIIGIDYINQIFPIRSFNHSKSLKSKTDKILRIHGILIDSNIIRNEGYSFKSLCCKMDPIVYMENNYGIAINGGFFDVNNSYEMLGEYRQFIDRYYESNKEISALYSEYFGYIIIDNGTISIEKYGDKIGRYDNVFMSGPLLIWNGKALFTEETMYTTKYINDKEVKIFQCQNKTPPSNNKIIDDKFNCDLIKPSELSHGGNPNPRTMLIIRDDPLDIIFVTVEGRSKESDGADFLDLIEIAQSFNAKHTINLDGGVSSNMVWRSISEPNIIAVTNRINAYPVGNIITLSKPI